MSSSSSEDEDWSRFQAAAVTAEDVAVAAKKERDHAQAHRAKRQREANPTSANVGTGGGDSNETFSELDPISVKIAAALDVRLESELKWEPVKKKTKKKKPELAGESVNTAEEDLNDGFSFFRGVRRGAPCILVKPEEPETAGQQAPTQRPTIGRQYPKLDTEALKSIAQDGQDLMNCALGGMRGCSNVKLPVEGTVLEARRQVPQEQRILKLLGLQKQYIV